MAPEDVGEVPAPTSPGIGIRAELLRQHREALPRVPVHRVVPGRMDPHQHLARSCRRPGHLLVHQLLQGAQDAGRIHPDADGTDLFTLVNALSWITGQAPTLATRREHPLALALDGLAHRGTQPDG